ncbi:MAG: response regulator [Candidatus Riflebacteria bacterium]|nr:response regulator [Candidatus Riflebacteria bacterium]
MSFSSYLSSIKIAKRFFIGFAVLIAFTLGIGIIALFEVIELSEINNHFFNHPFTVNIETREALIGSLQMNRIMRNYIFQVTDGEAFPKKEIDDLEIAVNSSLAIVKNRYKGDPQEPINAISLFKEYVKSFHSCEQAIRNNEIEKAKKVYLSDSRQSFILFEKYLRDIVAFAKGRAIQLNQESIQEQENTKYFIAFLLVVVTFLAVSISITLSKSITEPISLVCRHANDVASGILIPAVENLRKDELGDLFNSLNNIIESNNKITEQAREIASGNYSVTIVPRSEKDETVIAIKTMTESLKKSKIDSDLRIWAINGRNNLTAVLIEETKESSIAQKIISFFSEYTKADAGAIFLFNEDKNKLIFCGGTALPENLKPSAEIEPGYGLVGRAAIEGKSIVIEEVPENYFSIASTTGKSDPGSLAVIPFFFKGNLKGIIELAFLKKLDVSRIRFVEECENIIAPAIQDAQYRTGLEKLLRETTEQSQILVKQQNELQTQQAELQATNQELEQYSEELKVSNEKLENQTLELKNSNQELEEKKSLLEAGKAQMVRHNIELENARLVLEQKATELERMSLYKTEFLTKMSHELRTPLNSIMLLSRSISDNTSKTLSESEIESAQIIYKSGTDLLELINDILDLAKIEAGKITLNLEKVSISSLANSLKRSFIPLFEEKKLRFSITIDEKFPEKINTDLRKMEQIIRNLLSNALKFTPSGGVSLSFKLSEKKKNAFEISVSDTGIGIPADMHKKIFEPFEQIDSGIARKYSGTGLGLSISQELAKLLGGYIELDSKPEQGTTFTLVLSSEEENMAIKPLQESKPAVSPSSTNIQLHNSKNESRQKSEIRIPDDRDSLAEGDKKILVIEDDPIFAQMLTKLCRDKGFKVIYSDNGETGLSLLKDYLPDAVLLDLKLPGMDGMKVLSSIKQNPAIRHIPVHVISGMDSSMEALRNGAIGFLRKPVDPDKLEESFSAIQRMINLPIKKLLIVEDDPASRISIRKIVGNGDVKAYEAGEAEEAFNLIQANDFDCIILDIMLPGMSGFDLLEKLRSESSKRIPPVIVYSGREFSREEEARILSQGDSIILKGVHSDERLLDEASLFLHRIVKNLPPAQQRLINKLHDHESIFTGKKILLVDDDLRNLFSLSKILIGRKFEVFKAESGEKALKLLEQNPDVNLILMDIMMPEMDGYETTRKIRKIPLFKNIPIIALTAKAMRDDRDKCIEAGANDYLTKPVDVDKLTTMLSVWLYSREV